MASHPCPRCKGLIPVGVAYCDTCKPVAEAQAAEAREHRQALRRAKYNRDYQKRRDPRYLAFYRSKEWRTLSRAKLQDCGYRCQAGLEGCTRLAVEVHHVQPIQTAAGWDARLAWTNLEALCTTCHNRRHRRFDHPTVGQGGVLDLRTVQRRGTDSPPLPEGKPLGGGSNSTRIWEDNDHRRPASQKKVPTQKTHVRIEGTD